MNKREALETLHRQLVKTNRETFNFLNNSANRLPREDVAKLVNDLSMFTEEFSLWIDGPTRKTLHAAAAAYGTLLFPSDGGKPSGTEWNNAVAIYDRAIIEL